MFQNTVLVTGSSGFIGFHLSNYLISKNYNIIGIDSLNSYYSVNLKKKRLSILKKKKNFFFKKLNLTNKKDLENLFVKYKPTVVIHLAGQPGVLYSFKNPKSYYINNVEATKVLCDISKKYGVKKFIFGSSSSIYGDQKKYPIKEYFSPNPKNPYAKSKLMSEKLVLKNFKKTKTKFIIFRFFTVYGPYGRPDMFIHKFLNKIKKKESIKLHNFGLNFRDFTFVGDVVKIIHLSVIKKLSNKIFNICRSKPILTNKLVEMIEKKFPNKSSKLIKKGFVKGEMLKTHGSNELLLKNIGRLSFTDIKVGIDITIREFKKNNF